MDQLSAQVSTCFSNDTSLANVIRIRGISEPAKLTEAVAAGHAGDEGHTFALLSVVELKVISLALSGASPLPTTVFNSIE